MLLAVFEFGERFVERGLMAFRYPPHDEMHLTHHLEPLFAAFVEFLMHGAPDEFFEALDIFPDGEV